MAAKQSKTQNRPLPSNGGSRAQVEAKPVRSRSDRGVQLKVDRLRRKIERLSKELARLQKEAEPVLKQSNIDQLAEERLVKLASEATRLAVGADRFRKLVERLVPRPLIMPPSKGVQTTGRRSITTRGKDELTDQISAQASEYGRL